MSSKKDKSQESLPLGSKTNSIAAFTAIMWTNYLGSQLRDPLERSQAIVMVEMLTAIIKSLESGQLVAHSIVETKDSGEKKEFIVTTPVEPSNA